MDVVLLFFFRQKYKTQKLIKMSKNKCYLYKTSWEFLFSDKVYLAQNVQLC